MTRLRTIALAAVLAIPPAAALAQPPDPNDPNKPADPPAEPTSPTDVPTTAPPTPPPTEPPPTVIVNPPPQATVISTEPGYETVQDPFNAPLFTSGAITFAASYGAAVVAAAAMNDDDRDQWGKRLYVPVAGPWLALNDHGDCPIQLARCDDSTTTKVLLVADGIMQGVGVIGMFAGIVSPSYHTRPIRTAMDTKVRVRPTVVGRSGSGLTVFGRW